MSQSAATEHQRQEADNENRSNYDNDEQRKDAVREILAFGIASSLKAAVDCAVPLNGRHIRISKTTPNEIAPVLAPSTSATWLNVTRTVPFVHVIEPFAEAAERHRHFNDVGKFAFD